MVLWLIAIMAIFGIGLARSTWASYRFAAFRANNFLSLQAVNAVVLISKFNRMRDETPDYDTLPELPYEAEYEFGSLKVVYSLIDEERLININKAPSSVLKDLPDMDMDKAVAIVNSTLRPFRIKEEVLLIDEIEEEDYFNIKDLVTLYGEGQVNVNTCSEETMDILGMEDGLKSSIEEFRTGADGEPNTEDDGAFESASGIINTLREETYLSLSEEQTLVSLISKNILGVKSDNYKLKADVYVNDKLINSYSIIFGKEKKGGKEKYILHAWEQH